MWLYREGIYDAVRNHVEANDYDWDTELDNFYVAEGLHQALVAIKPTLFSSPTTCVEALSNLYPFVQDISNDEMVKAIRQCLTKDDRFPLTLVVLDEIQQYIGENSERSMDVQETVEACCKDVGGKLLFIGTGQTAVTGTSNLKRLEGRFTVRIELSDADVDAVIRKVILAKNPESKGPLEEVMQTNLGEISRHLSGTTIGHRQSDIQYFSQDYPVLPVRRRFWENTLRVLDQTGTDSQLRNQLSMIHKVIQTNLDDPLGHVVPADYLYFDSADKLLQGRILPRKVYEKTMTWSQQGAPHEQLMARACGLVFLINKLGENNEIGIHATVDTLADLLVEDLSQGSSSLRSTLPSLLDKCELLIRIGDEFRIQTEESAAWNDDFLRERNILANEAHRIDTDRDDRIRAHFTGTLKQISLTQGTSKVGRSVFPVFASQLPTDSDKHVCIWIRDGWSIDENSVRAEARQAGNQSSTTFVFIPKRSADDLRHYLIEFKAANATLESRGVPNTPEGVEARSAMETIKHTAEGKIRELLDEAFSGIRVFQGGGSEILGNDLREMLSEASNNALSRLYPQFAPADHSGWGKVYEKAQKGAPDALKAVAYEGDPQSHPVCKTILSFIASGKRGTDIRSNFEDAPFGWSRDAVDGGLQVLLVAGLIRALDDRGRPIDSKEMARQAIGKTMFKVESTTVSTAQRIQIRKVLQKAGITPKQGEEQSYVASFIEKLTALADRAGGEAPKPERPDKTFLDEIRLSTGNDQLITLYNRRDELSQSIDEWERIGTKIEARWPCWLTLQRLIHHAANLSDAAVLTSQVNHVATERQLLDEPDLIAPLIQSVSQLLRAELNRLDQEYRSNYEQGLKALYEDGNWQQLDEGQQNQILSQHSLQKGAQPKVEVGSSEEVLKTLETTPLATLADRVAAIPARFPNVSAAAAKLLEPAAQFVSLPRRTLKSDAEIAEWVDEVRTTLESAAEKGLPIVIQ
jgi:hypothetical protein